MSPGEEAALVREMAAFRIAISQELGQFQAALGERMRGVEEVVKSLRDSRTEDRTSESRYRDRHDEACQRCRAELEKRIGAEEGETKGFLGFQNRTIGAVLAVNAVLGFITFALGAAYTISRLAGG